MQYVTLHIFQIKINPFSLQFLVCDGSNLGPTYGNPLSLLYTLSSKYGNKYLNA